MAPSTIYLEKLDLLRPHHYNDVLSTLPINIPAAWDLLIETCTKSSLVYGMSKGAARILAYVASREYLRLTGISLDSFIEHMRDLHIRKNAGYSGDDSDPWKNFRAVEAFGISATAGCLTRLCDKYGRWCVLSKDPTKDLVQESISDTLMDMIAYCLIYICLMEEQHG